MDKCDGDGGKKEYHKQKQLKSILVNMADLCKEGNSKVLLKLRLKTGKAL